MQKYLRWGILAGIFVVPFIPFIVTNQFFFPFITGKNFTFRILVEIIFALWVILSLYDTRVRPKKSALWFGILIFVGSIGISALLGENSSKSIWSNFERMEGWITVLHLGAYFTVLTSVLKDEKYWKWLWNTSIVSSVLLALYGVMQLAGFFVIHQGGVRVDATFGNAAYLAVYMLFHVFMTLYALVRWNPSRWVQIWYALALVLQALMIYYAATRGTTLGLLGGLLLSGIIFAFFSKKSEIGTNALRKGGIALVVGVLVLIGGFLLVKDSSFVRNSDVLGRFASISLEEGQTRFTIWNMALKGGLERPLLGWGQENFNYVFNANYQASMYGQEPWFDRAHNQFLDWLIAGGFLGFFLYCFFYICALWYLWRGNAFTIKERAVFTGLLGAYAFHNLFVFDNLMSSMLFFGLLAYITTRSTEDKPEVQYPEFSDSVRSLVSGVVVVLLVAVLYVANVPGIVRSSNMIKALQPHEGGLEENFNYFKKAVTGGGIGRQEAHEQLAQFAVQIRRQDLQSLSTAELRNEVALFTREAFSAEIARTPEDARLRMFYGSFLRQIGDFDTAEVELTKALELSPQKQAIMFELGLLGTLKNDAASAVSWFKKAYDLAPEYDQARLLYASILIRVGQESVADGVLLERFGTVTPSNEVIMQAYYDTGNYVRAIQIAKTRLEEAPEDVNRYTQLAGVYISAGERTNAIAVLRRAIETVPGFKAQGEEFIRQIQLGEI